MGTRVKGKRVRFLFPSNTDLEGFTDDDPAIESRVARIKARVAELTGAMPAPGAEPAKA